MGQIGQLLIIAGVVLALIGVVLMFGDKLPFRLGRLPGDLVWRGKNTTIYFPLTTILLVNILLMAVMWLFRRR